ncbi:MAG: amidohydrolase family protein [Gammaproteobacteria bacterium]
MNTKLYDADAHVVEPPDVWQNRVPGKLRALAPRVVKKEDGNDAWCFEDGKRKSTLGMLLATPGVSPTLWTLAGTTYESMRPGAYDPRARLQDMDIDMVHAQVLHPSVALGGPAGFSETNAELQVACTVAYNDWISEFCRADPARLHGLGLIPVTGIDAAIAELERIGNLSSMCGVMLSAFPNGGTSPLPEDDRFWARAQEMNLPIIIHVSLLGGEGEGSDEVFALPSKPLILARINLERSARGIMDAMSQIILTGILERFPRLCVIGTETGIGWIPYFLEQTDDNYLRHRFWAQTELRMLPSEYFYRQCFATFQVDTYGVANRAPMLDNIMWSSDYPHSGADWPNSVVSVQRHMAGVPEPEQVKILQSNCVRAFGLGAP